MRSGFKLCSRDFWVRFCCMREDVNALGLSAQDVNVLRLRWKHTVLSTLSKLSESKCIFVLRFKRKGRSCRSRGLSALTSSPRRSSASALSGSALRIAFLRYALSKKAGRHARLLVAVRLIWHVKSTGLYIWAKSRFEGAWNALCNFKLCQSAHASRFATLHPDVCVVFACSVLAIYWYMVVWIFFEKL